MSRRTLVPFQLVCLLLAGGTPALGLDSVAHAATAPSARVVLKGMVCAYCAQGFERRLTRHAEVSSVEVRLATHDAIIQFKDGAILTEAQLRQVADEAGLGVSAVTDLAGRVSAVTGPLENSEFEVSLSPLPCPEETVRE